MKNKTAMTNAERQKEYRKRLKKNAGTRTTVILSAEASEALDMILSHEDITKKAAAQLIMHALVSHTIQGQPDKTVL